MKYRFIWVRVTANHGDEIGVGLVAFEAYETIGGPNVLTGGTAYANPSTPLWLPIDRAFNGELSPDNPTVWLNKPSVKRPVEFGYDLGEGNEKEIADIGIASCGGAIPERAIKSFEVYGSNTGMIDKESDLLASVDNMRYRSDSNPMPLEKVFTKTPDLVEIRQELIKS